MSENVQDIKASFIMKVMENWKMELAAGGQNLAEVFVIEVMPFSYILIKCIRGYKVAGKDKLPHIYR